LARQVSAFTLTGGGKVDEGTDDLPIDEDKMEKALTSLAGEAERIDENDPRQAAGLMRKFSGMTGMELGKGMQDALDRMEAGEDPEKIEAEMSDIMDSEEPFVLPGEKGKVTSKGKKNRGAPVRDGRLYEM